MPEGERRLAAIMFTDMVGYTALGQRNESLSLSLVEEQRRIIRLVLSKHNGTEVKTIGDAFLVEFASALDAVNCAVEIQRAMEEANRSSPEERKIAVRIGIHLGDVVHQGGDVAGDAVNVASRIEPLSPPGGVCVSAQVHDSVANKVEFEFESLGVPELKNVAMPIEIYRVSDLGGQVGMPVQKGVLPKERIAVLPFANMSPDPMDGYFADGMTEELISALSKIEGLGVISRTSVMQYKRNPKGIRDVSRELHAGTVLEGSVRKVGNKLRVTVQLIDSAKDLHLWSENYDRNMEDVFTTQSEIAERVAEALKVRLLAGEKARLEKEPTKNIEAYTDCLRGIQTIRKGWTEEDTKKAIASFKDAIELDPTYAAPYAWLATCYLAPLLTATIGSILPADEATPIAEAAIRRALELDPYLPEAHLAQGQLYKLRFNWISAEEEIREALRLNPSVAGGHATHAWTLASMGRYNEALAAAKRALSLDPLSPDTYESLALVQYCLQDYDGAIKSGERMAEWGANPMLVASRLGWFYLAKSQYDKASELWEKVGLRADLAVLYAKTGRIEDARRILGQVEAAGAESSAWASIEIHLALGENEEAIRLLERAYDYHDVFTFTLLNIVHLWGDVRPDPRVVRLAEKTGLR